MRVFVDTSALYSLLDRPSEAHADARERFELSRTHGDELMTHNYVVGEACALAQRRLGADFAVALLRDILPVLNVVWVSPEVHDAAVAAFISAASRSVSLVDRVSFEVMRREGIDTAFAFDDDFVKAGFQTVP